jgi:hypothetical protein
MVWIPVAVVWALGLLLYSTLPPSPDQWYYEYTGWLLTEGATPYVTFVDGSWPVCHWLHALSTLLFGNALWSWRVFDFLFIVLPCTLFGADLLRRTWTVSAGVWFLLLYPALYITVGRWFAGQRDILAGNLLMVCLWFYWLGLDRRNLRLQVGTGALIAATALIKPPFALTGFVLAAHAAFGAWRGRWTPRTGALHIVVAGSSSLLFLAAAVLILLAQGVPAETLYDYCVRLATSRVGTDHGGFATLLGLAARFWWASWHWILLSALLGAGLALARGGAAKWPELLLFLCIWLVGVISYFMQIEGFVYTLGPTFTGSVGMMCIGLGLAQDQMRTSRDWTRWLAAAWLVVAVGGTAKKWRGDYAPAIALFTGSISRAEFDAGNSVGDGIDVASALQLSEELGSLVPADGTVLVWGRANAINVLSRRPQPTRFFHNVMLYYPGRPDDLARRFDLWFKEDLETSRPEYCLVNRQEFADYPDPLPPAIAFLESFLSENYVSVRTVGDSVLYRRADLTPETLN